EYVACDIVMRDHDDTFRHWQNNEFIERPDTARGEHWHRIQLEARTEERPCHDKALFAVDIFNGRTSPWVIDANADDGCFDGRSGSDDLRFEQHVHFAFLIVAVGTVIHGGGLLRFWW